MGVCVWGGVLLKITHWLWECCGWSPFSCYVQKMRVSLLKLQSCCFQRWRSRSPLGRGAETLLDDHSAMALLCSFQTITRKAKRTITNEVYEDMRGTLRRWEYGCRSKDGDACREPTRSSLTCLREGWFRAAGPADASERLHTLWRTQTLCLLPVSPVFLL